MRLEIGEIIVIVWWGAQETKKEETDTHAVATADFLKEDHKRLQQILTGPDEIEALEKGLYTVCDAGTWQANRSRAY